jgi:general secretion pathway protein D
MKKSTTSLASTVGLLLFIAQGFIQAQEGAPKIETNQPGVDATVSKTDEEAARRQERDFQFNEALQDGDRLSEAKEFDKALVKYDFVIRNVPANRPPFEAAKLGVAKIKVMQADEALTAKDLEKSKALIAEAKSLAPNDKGIQRASSKFDVIYEKVQDQKRNVTGTENNPAVTTQLKENLQQVEKFLYEGDRLKETGQYDAAKNRYERVLAIDKYNKAARERLTELQKSQKKMADLAHEVSRKNAMNQVTERWSEPVLMENVVEGRPTELSTTISNVAKMRKKLEEIVIKEISFNEAPIEDVVSFLTAKSREADPTGEGVNFVLKQGGAVAPTLTTVKGASPAPKASKIPPVTITLSNLPLSEVLRFINTTTGLKTQIDDYAVVLLPQSDDATTLSTRTFAVPAGFLSSSGSAKGGAIDVKKDLTDKGVSFTSEQSKAVFLPSTSKMVVKNTQDQLDVIQGLIDAVALKEEPQVEIEARLVEFTDDALKELSFNYIVGVSNTNRSYLRQAGNAFSVAAPNVSAQNALLTTGLRDGQNTNTGQFPTATSAVYGGLTQSKLDSLLSLYPFSSSTAGVIYPQTPNVLSASFDLGGNAVGMLLRAIDQLSGADILVSPKVVTRNRTAAKIEIGREMKYPSAYDAPEVSGTAFQYNNTLVTIPIPATPSDFKSETIGVNLSVTPTTFPDQRIDIKLDQEVKDFEGFINYGSPIVQGNTTSATVTNLTSGVLNQPVFNNRKLTTDLTVMNGMTIVMGGFIREDRQKVNDKIPLLGDLPYLGRLFRSESEKSLKKNLMLFLTARLVNSKGKPFYEMPEDFVEVTSNNNQ